MLTITPFSYQNQAVRFGQNIQSRAPFPRTAERFRLRGFGVPRRELLKSGHASAEHGPTPLAIESGYAPQLMRFLLVLGPQTYE